MQKLFTSMALCIGLLASSQAIANQDQTISIELNKVEQTGDNCRLLFLAHNGLNEGLDNLSYETVLLDQQGNISLLAVLDFLDLPAGKLRMRQFEFADLQCSAIKQILFNSLINCQTNSGNADQCHNNLMVKSATNIELLD